METQICAPKSKNGNNLNLKSQQAAVAHLRQLAVAENKNVIFGGSEILPSQNLKPKAME
jgi:hypothetical protein